ncbi:MAG: LysM peptidoglycan-binding domain-containing protein [Tunicatimonas sp.]
MHRFLPVRYPLLLIGLLATYASYATAPADSVGLERNLGELFVLHQVGEGETLFAIAQRYRVPMNDLRGFNQQTNTEKLNIGDTLRIPLFPALAKGKKVRHRVEEGQTLFSIARKHGVPVNDIRTWNALEGQSIAIGQDIIVYLEAPADKAEASPDADRYELHTVREGETLYAIARSYGVAVDELRRRNQLEGEGIRFGQTLVIREKELKGLAAVTPVVPAVETTPPAPPAQPKRVSRSQALEAERQRFEGIKDEERKTLEAINTVSETGFASVIEGGTNTRKYLALHRSAPVGTVLRVRNEMNSMSVFVRVVGKLPNTGVNNKVTIRLTQAAYDKLGGINERFPVEISYLK